jgi:2-oxoglutarate/2-oxoacid ferredoxin oxidoreductase subunit beta
LSNCTLNDLNSSIFPTWCPGCGDFGIWSALKTAISESEIDYKNLVVVYGVGCSGNMADFVKSYGFHGLHGRALPAAAGIKLANHKLTVVAVVGDGDCLGEGMSHFIAASRANYDMTVIIHNNGVYGLTTGQVAPTSLHGFKSKSTPAGIIEKGVNPSALGILTGATFAARTFAQDIAFTKETIKAGIKHSGFSVVDVLQPCVTWNKGFGYDFYRQRVYKLDDKYDRTNKNSALQKAMEHEDDWEKLATGIFYEESRPAYHEQVTQIQEKTLVEQKNTFNLEKFIEEFK